MERESPELHDPQYCGHRSELLRHFSGTRFELVERPDGNTGSSALDAVDQAVESLGDLVIRLKACAETGQEFVLELIF